MKNLLISLVLIFSISAVANDKNSEVKAISEVPTCPSPNLPVPDLKPKPVLPDLPPPGDDVVTSSNLSKLLTKKRAPRPSINIDRVDYCQQLRTRNRKWQEAFRQTIRFLFRFSY